MTASQATPQSVAPVPLFQPRVAENVIAVGLPETRLVLVLQPEAAHPLRALPEVEVRHQQPRRPAVLRLERLAVVVVGDPCLAIRDVLERQVRRVTPVAEREQVAGIMVDESEERVERDALPDGVELRPLGDAMDVGRDLLARQGLELVPRPARRL